MKKLTGVRIINWHAFINETIEINDSVLISGDNGAGKSTILDAIQFVLTCSEKNFNKAANESSKRKLVGYVRYKTGKEGKKFERENNVVSHIALEFYEEEKKRKFIIGVVIDSSSEVSADSKFYRIENMELKSIEFIDGVPKSITEFKRYASEFKIQMFKASEAKRDFRNRLGNFNEKFFELLPKALSFKPISNVKEFVYSYVLEEKNINVEELRENIRIYREFEYLLDEVKIKVEKLEEINLHYRNWEKGKELSDLHNYLVIKAEENILIDEINLCLKNIEKNNYLINEVQEKKRRKNEEIESENKYRNNIEIQIQSNEEFKIVEKLQNDLIPKIREKEKLGRERDILYKQINTQQIYLKNLYKNHNFESYNFKNIYGEVYEMLLNIRIENLEILKLSFEKNAEVIEKMKNTLYGSIAELKIGNEKIFEELKRIQKIIGELNSRKLQYPEEVVKLKALIIQEAEKIGKKVNPKILCDLLEITDTSWQNAIEGYLNKQKFYLIVEEEDFDYAISVYDKFKKIKKLYGYGIINIGKLSKFKESDENSLGRIVTSKNKSAKQFINSILGNVIRCDKVSELKSHKISITKECMMHKNNVVRAISPKKFEIPFIGNDAWSVQLKRKEEEANILKVSLNEKNIEFKSIESHLNILVSVKLKEIAEKLNIIKEYDELEKNIAKLEYEIKENQEKSTYIDLVKRKEEIEKKINEIKKKISELDKSHISYMANIKENERIKKEKDVFLKKKIFELEMIYTENIVIAEEGELRFKLERENKTNQVIKNNFFNSRSRYEKQQLESEDNLKIKQLEYNNIYEFGAEIGLKNIAIFQKELDNLKKSKIIEFEEKVKDAKNIAEEEFKEHFISKLKEYIECARLEFKTLNKGLKGIFFGEEEYEFKLEKNNELTKYHDMVMDEENLVQGFNLFTGSFQNKYKESLEELFEKLTIDDSNSEEYLRKFTDYRNYMEYDILLKYKDGSKAKFSKVCKEKSGGETQTPYYVIIASSFLQLYRNSYTNRESMELIIFDEAFDKMDEGRIVSMMQFYKNLGLQVIVAAPPQKIESIAPYVSTTLLAMKMDKSSIIEVYSYEEL